VLKVQIKNLNSQSSLPSRGSDLAAGWDLCAAGDARIPARSVKRVPLGVVIAIPAGWYAQANPRSGMCARGIEASVGTIDADYRGELVAVVKNLTDKDYWVLRGDRVVQLVFLPVPEVTWEAVAELDETPRGKGGFGSTGR
jgi:deoxyuridine 5'-triphosphate nucleotidohydrolase